MKTVYGPVPSWRLGRSLGIDPICKREKTCSFDCIYCQLGRTKNKTNKLQNFVEGNKVTKELKEALKKAEADVITFSGSGEPTLAKNLSELVDVVREESDLPVAILTNSSLLNLEEVREVLKKFDIVVVKLDAPNEKIFKEINRPFEGIRFADVVNGIKKLRKEFKGEKFAIQSMFVENNKKYAGEIAYLVTEIEPDETQIDTPLRPCPVKPISREEIEKIKRDFVGLNILSVYDVEKPKVKILDFEETRIRRPEL